MILNSIKLYKSLKMSDEKENSLNNYDGYDYDDYDSDGKDGNDDADDDCLDSYNFIDYNDLLSVAEQEDTPDVDKITNIINAMIKTTKILNCEEVSFKFDFEFGEYNKWIETANLFNDKICSNDYRILIDEDAIVCKYININDD
jgi:hypothetical protein